MLTYDLYWSFRSPYSYLVTRRLRALEDAYEVRCNVRPVYPAAVRSPEFLETRDPLWFTYLRLDIKRQAEFLGLPIRWPKPDPVVQDATGAYPEEQPYIRRLTFMAIAAAERGRGLEFLDEVGSLLWSGEVRGWNEGDHLLLATERAGLDFAELSGAVESDWDGYVAKIAENQAAQRLGGHYGVPLMVFDGEPFFGQDHYDQLEWRMRQKGLTSRAARAAG